MAGELIRAINAITAGQRYLCPKVAVIVVDDYIHAGKPGSSQLLLDKLTGKECELFQLITGGKSTKEVARMLHISDKTIDARRRDIMKKLKIFSIAELTKIAIREDLTSVEF